MKSDSDEVGPLLRPTVESMGYEMLGIEVQKSDSSSIVRVYIDSDKGITLTDCESVSHQLNGVLDVEDPISGHYTLEISSPGIDRPLFELDQFTRFIGSRVKVKLEQELNGRRNFTGIIKEVGDDTVILLVDNLEHSLVFETIQSARLAPESHQNS